VYTNGAVVLMSGLVSKEHFAIFCFQELKLVNQNCHWNRTENLEMSTVVNSDSNLTPIQTMMCGAKESSNQYQSKHKQ